MKCNIRTLPGQMPRMVALMLIMASFHADCQLPVQAVQVYWSRPPRDTNTDSRFLKVKGTARCSLAVLCFLFSSKQLVQNNTCTRNFPDYSCSKHSAACYSSASTWSINTHNKAADTQQPQPNAALWQLPTDPTQGFDNLKPYCNSKPDSPSVPSLAA